MTDPLATAATFDEYVDQLTAYQEEQAAAARAARLAGAKTNLDALIAVGVVVTCDDEYDRAMAHLGCTNRAKAAGRSYQEQRAIESTHKARRNAWEGLGRVLARTETPDEERERRAAILDGVEGYQPGKARRCRHNPTKRVGGWGPVIYEGHPSRGTDQEVRYCSRCGERSPDLTHRGSVTWRAHAARAHAQRLLETVEAAEVERFNVLGYAHL